MTQYAIVTDLNRCVGCLACSVACKTANNVRIGNYWNKVRRVGPYTKSDGCGQFPDVDMYFMPLQCQHCTNPACVEVCPTGATVKQDNGIVSIDADACIGCGQCVNACPYGVRYVNVDTNVAEKCSMCADKLDKDELPQCVLECGGRARFFGNIDEGIESFRGPAPMDVTLGDDLKKVNDTSYEAQMATTITLGEYVEPFEDTDVHQIDDLGTAPNMLYILRGKEWQPGCGTDFSLPEF